MIIRTILASLLVLVGGGAVLLLFPPENDRGGPTPPESAKRRSAGASIADSSGGPTTPQQQLFVKASREGIDAVRGEFCDQVQKNLRQIKPAIKGAPELYGSEPAFYDGGAASDAGGYAFAWAYSEAEAIYRGAPVPDDFDEAIWKPLFEAATKSRTAFVDAIDKLEQWQDAGFPEDAYDQEIDKLLRSREVSEEKQKELRQRIRQNLRDNFEHQLVVAKHGKQFTEGLFLELANLAKIAKRPDLVKQVYKAYDAPLPKWTVPEGGYYERIGELASAEEFLEYDHRALFEKKYGVPPPPQPEPPPPDSKFPVTEKEQKAIKELFKTLGDAVVAEDVEKVLSLYVGDLDKTKSNLTHDLSNIKMFSYDMSKAQFKFFRDEKDGPVRVEVTDLIVDQEISGKREKTTTGRSLKIVVFVDGNPKIRMFQK